MSRIGDGNPKRQPLNAVAGGASVTTVASIAVGLGPQGLGLGGLFVFFTIPLTLYAAFLGILSITGKQGRLPGAIALVVTAGAFLYGIYSMALEGMS